jgi:hypothetical protein
MLKKRGINKRKLVKVKGLTLTKWLLHRIDIELDKHVLETPVNNVPKEEIPVYIAVVLEKNVLEVLSVDEKIAAILLSEPKFAVINVKHYPIRPTLGWTYDESTNEFLEPTNE